MKRPEKFTDLPRPIQRLVAELMEEKYGEYVIRGQTQFEGKCQEFYKTLTNDEFTTKVQELARKLAKQTDEVENFLFKLVSGQ